MLKKIKIRIKVNNMKHVQKQRYEKASKKEPNLSGQTLNSQPNIKSLVPPSQILKFLSNDRNKLNILGLRKSLTKIKKLRIRHSVCKK